MLFRYLSSSITLFSWCSSFVIVGVKFSKIKGRKLNLGVFNCFILKITIISSVVGHGKILHDSGTGITLLLSREREIDAIELLTWVKDSNEQIRWPNNISINEMYSDKFPFSSFKIIRKIVKSKMDHLFFNIMPTAYGKSNIANLVGLITPIVLKTVFKKRVKVLFHNSVYTNDFKNLGYYGIINHLKSIILRLIELLLLKNVEVFMLNEQYVKIIKRKVPEALISYINLQYFQVVGTLHLNSYLDKESISIKKSRIPNVLIFGSWGPQKDPLPILEALRKLKEKRKEFKVTVAGGINQHFPHLRSYYDTIFSEFEDVIDNKVDYVNEKDVLHLFLNTDLVVLNYNVPGGFSSVMSLGIFFMRFLIVPDFLEFRVQAKDYSRILFTRRENLEQSIEDYIDRRHKQIPEDSQVSIREKVDEMISTLRTIISR